MITIYLRGKKKRLRQSSRNISWQYFTYSPWFSLYNYILFGTLFKMFIAFQTNKLQNEHHYFSIEIENIVFRREGGHIHFNSLQANESTI